MPYGNALFSYLWFTAFVKMVNMAPYLCPGQEDTLDVLFERKIPKPDGSPSDEYFINEYLVAFLMFNIACALNASYNHRKEKTEVFRTNVAILKAAAAAGKDWRAQLRDSLKKWEPEFEAIVKKKRRITLDDAPVRSSMYPWPNFHARKTRISRGPRRNPSHNAVIAASIVRTVIEPNSRSGPK